MRKIFLSRKKENEKVTEAKDLDRFGVTIDKIKICSLSSSLEDVRLWSYYADGHKGVVFEIDFSGLETRNGLKIIHPVHYSEKLPPCPPFQTVLGGEQTKPHDLFSHKTDHWFFEYEHRIIDESKYLEEGTYFGIKGRIKNIYLGTRTSDIHCELLKKIVPSEISIWTTKINEKKIIVEPYECIQGQKVLS